MNDLHVSDPPAAGQASSLVTWLSDARHYPHPADPVECIETHISWVFLAGRFAYKLKKPVRFEFLDFADRHARHQACQDEVRLNRRLAPDVYLGVVSVGRDARGRFCWDPDGEPLDWLVKMRRLDPRRTLDHRIRAGDLSAAEVEGLAETLARFYASLPPLPLPTSTYRDRFEKWIRGNFRDLTDLVPRLSSSQIARIQTSQYRFLDVCGSLLDDRVRDGRIVEGHGDLRPDHIYLHTRPVIIDCIEFRRDFRELDPVDELSFLAMECRYRDAEWIGRKAIESYTKTAGDHPAPQLLAFYASYRACVRAKVLGLRAQQLPPSDRTATEEASRRYLELADQYAQALGGPWLVIVRGLTGTGKSSLARQLADAWRTELLQTDAIRRRRFGAADSVVGYDEGAYRPENRSEVYALLLEAAGERLSEGQSVIVDGTFLSHALRAQASALAEEHGARALFIELDCPPEVSLDRIAQRAQTQPEYQSSAEVYWKQRAAEAHEAYPEGAAVCRVDSTQPLQALCESVRERVRPWILQNGESQ